MRKGILFIISAPSGAGKTSLCKQVIDILPNLRHSVSYTTRPARPGEKHGKDYFFVSADEFRRMAEAGEFAEWAEVHGNFYGTSKKTLSDFRDAGIDVILDIDCQGASQLKERYEGGVFVFILPPSFDELRRRLDTRNSDSADIIERRIRNASAEISESCWYDYVIINDVFSTAVDQLRSIIVAERSRNAHVIDQVRSAFNI